jgi:hypothetical protein
MRSNKYSKSKRNPFLRFIRGIFRLFKVIFRSNRKNLKSAEDYQNELRMAELERRNREIEERSREQLITVGELFERVKWQASQSNIVLEQPLDTSMADRIQDVSLN